MRKITAFLIRYPIWVTVLFFAIFCFGLVALSQMRYSFFPESEPDNIIVQVSYPGASPEEVAEGVVLKIEEQLEGIQGVERVTSISRENVGTVTVETVFGADVNEVLNDVKNAVDRVSSFPEGAEKPVIYEQPFRMLTLQVALSGETDLYNLKYLAEELRDELLATPEISEVDLLGLPNLEFSIEISEADLRRYQLTFDEVAAAVARNNVNISGGKLETVDEELLIRAWGRNYHAQELLDLPIRGNIDGTAVYLRDIAKVKEQWEDVPDKFYYNGNTGVVLRLIQTQDEDLLAIAKVTKKIAHEFVLLHPTLRVDILQDATIPLLQRIKLLVKNGLFGLLLVVIALGFFLNLRLSFWVALSIPFAFAGMFIIASAWGITINVLSLFGMIIVVGILVDDGIVVGENIFAHFERGKSALNAAIDGAREVAVPVLTSVFTTVVVFGAFFFLAGRLGEFMWQMALVVIASLIFSLLEAFFILPSHLAHSRGLRPQSSIPPVRRKLETIIKYMTNRLYAPLLRAALRNKWLTMVIPIALVMLTFGLVKGGFIGVTFFPHVDGDEFPINLTLTSGTQEAFTDSVLIEIEKVCWQVNEKLKADRPDGKDVIIGLARRVGANDFASGGNTGNIMVLLLDGEEREMESSLIGNRIRDAVGPIPQAESITFGSSGHFGKAISISLLGHDAKQLDRARDLLKAELESFSSLKDVVDTDQEGRREINITLKPRAHALGLTLRDVAGQVRQGFYGQEIQRIQRGRDEIRVWVRYRPEDRASLGSLDRMRIRTISGKEYPFSELADYKIERGIISIAHLDRMREVKVEANQADVDEDLPPILAEIKTDVLPRVLGQVQGVKASFEGQSREQVKMVDSMLIAFPMALLIMFVMLVLVFRSYAQAILVFSIIPIGVLGAIWGHGIHGMQVNLLSIIGIIALSGVIINDSIVFVDQINRYLRAGQKVTDAIYNAGIARFRPILLTTLTTSLGLAPLILETSRQAQFLIPMAISVAYGLLFGTFILLIILPASVLAFNRLRVWKANLFGGGARSPEAVEPAVMELSAKLVE